MDSQAVYAVCSSLAVHGVATVRFNFRPFGEAATEPGGTACQDAELAFSALRRWDAVRTSQCGVAGFSAGAAVIARCLKAFTRARAVALIAPPPACLRSRTLRSFSNPVLIVAGSDDRIARISDIEAAIADHRQRPLLFKINGADHSLAGAEQAVGEAVGRFFGEHLRR